MKYLLISFMLVFQVSGLIAQPALSRNEYIEKFYTIAQTEMRESGIPASITLAQALLESDNGNSKLARKANNHFGIKCHKGWDGPSFYQDDDKRKECFRKYKHAEESYKDHSLFLVKRERYSALFTLEITDYKSWAEGLKKAGYATNPKYAKLLIKIIEDNQLYKYDIIDPSIAAKPMLNPKNNTTSEDFEAIRIESEQSNFKKNGIRAVVVDKGSTMESIAKDAGITLWMLLKFNEIDEDYNPETDDILYLQPKRRKAGQKEHKCSGKESLWDVSMTYGVKLRRLEKMNNIDRKVLLPAGKVIFLR